VIWQSDGMMEVLNATLVDSPDANPLTYEVVSLHGLSTFSLDKAEASRPTVAPTVAPTATPVPKPEPTSMTGYLVIVSAFVIGVVAGIVTLVTFLWFRR
jgi:hypothetical protein